MHFFFVINSNLGVIVKLISSLVRRLNGRRARVSCWWFAIAFPKVVYRRDTFFSLIICSMMISSMIFLQHSNVWLCLAFRLHLKTGEMNDLDIISKFANFQTFLNEPSTSWLPSIDLSLFIWFCRSDPIDLLLSSKSLDYCFRRTFLSR